MKHFFAQSHNSHKRLTYTTQRKKWCTTTCGGINKRLTFNQLYRSWNIPASIYSSLISFFHVCTINIRVSLQILRQTVSQTNNPVNLVHTKVMHITERQTDLENVQGPLLECLKDSRFRNESESITGNTWQLNTKKSSLYASIYWQSTQIIFTNFKQTLCTLVTYSH